jgi:hypothetical protein
MGATPQRWAQAASQRRRSGLSPAATSRGGRVDPHAVHGDEFGGGGDHQLGEQPVDLLAFGVEGQGPPPQGPQGGLGGIDDRVGARPGAHSGGLLGDQAAGNALQGLADLLGAVKPRWRIWLRVLILVERPDRLATTRARMASTLPSLVLAAPS